MSHLHCTPTVSQAMNSLFLAHPKECPRSVPWGKENEITKLLQQNSPDNEFFWKVEFTHRSGTFGYVLLDGKLPKPEEMPLKWTLHLAANPRGNPIVFAEPTPVILPQFSWINSIQLLKTAGVGRQSLGLLPMPVETFLSEEAFNALLTAFVQDNQPSSFQNTLGTAEEAKEFRRKLKEIL